MKQEHTQVVIVGGGPNGIALAHYMGMYGIQSIVLEMSPDILPYPRAVGMDDEALRVLQTIGVADEVVKDMIQNVPLRYYNARGICFAEVKPSVADYGWPMRNIFMQQLLEKSMREMLQSYTQVELRSGHEMLDVSQTEESATVKVKDSNGEIYQISAKYVIGADGGRSCVRKKAGIQLEGLTHPHKWIVVDAAHDSLDAPYTALHADPNRPFVCIYLPYQQRRWEFMLFDGEDEESMCKEDNIRQLIRNHIGDAVDELEIIRIRAYTHNSRVANRFIQGRIILIGDAAHITPPWAGQGLNSGIRDVGNIAWKLAAVLKNYASEKIIASYDDERRTHATELVALADNMGMVLGLTNPLMAGVRDWLFQAFNNVDALRSHLVEFKFKPKPFIHKGLVYHPRPHIKETDVVGKIFIQPYVEDAQANKLKFDEILGQWYAVVAFRKDPLEHLSEQTRQFWQSRETRFIQINRAKSGLNRKQPLHASEQVICVEDVERKLEDWFDLARDEVVIVRPDRFIAATCALEKLEETLEKLACQLIN
ncbi:MULTISPECIES: bifunctional 3-(3-hydroxy-phenyl)propionate/3-hydroxycinnamic acid hydroxylase [Acinetobacter]|uniref:bifunctional 3-(3-hydroxy-phenyl)propionate/3-hydroxycinnamic acid hydroxylase n=1 Tax=Acinetobacter TaxID=469 RepID=UPI0004D67A71|nr:MULTISPECIES: bifunctional 3-(3-hydroxy-phenyl)propionate/3-hydroxycinnamic acid hydroxylase [unclassified Acinetobacter]KEC83338.1 3-(3-hydroxyphenyl)propionate hydroxylase [Acinetobacter sp. ETR1]WEE40882.1 bifunctional 3-(3-hydroxy-phenyl)propionate/3-hydroxycinnamic acid hydroxylase [Acinetobacter sp. TAC-1]